MILGLSCSRLPRLRPIPPSRTAAGERHAFNGQSTGATVAFSERDDGGRADVQDDDLCTIFFQAHGREKFCDAAYTLVRRANSREHYAGVPAEGGRECAFWSAISHSQYNLKRESGYTSAFWSANPHSIKATIGAVRYTHSAEAIGTISRRIGSTTLYPVEG